MANYLAALMLCLAPSTLLAQGWLPNGTPVCDSSVNSKYWVWHQLAPDGTGGAYICWYDTRTDKPRGTVFIQRISRDGDMLWTPCGMSFQPDSTTGYVHQAYPDVAANEEHGVYMAWQDTRFNSSHIFAQYFDPDGHERWKHGGIKVSDIAYSEYITTVPDQRGGVLVAFTHLDADDGAVYVQRIDSTGRLLWGSDGIRVRQSSSLVKYGAYSLIADGGGGACVAWIEGGYFDPNNLVFAQHIDPSGITRWGTDGLGVDGHIPYEKLYPVLVRTRSGAIYVSWSDARSPDHARSYLQRLTTEGTTCLTDSGIVVPGGWTQRNVVDDANGGVYVYIHDANYKRFSVQRVDSSGNFRWINSVPILTPWFGIHWDSDPSMCTDGNGGIFIFWEHDEFGVGFEIRVQHISGDGVVLFGPQGKIISMDRDTREDVRALNVGGENALVAWLDYRRWSAASPWAVLYAAIVTDAGILDVDELETVETGFDIECFPNPVLNIVTISCDLPEPAITTVGLYDSSGKSVSELHLGQRPAGGFQYTLDVRNVSNGIYYVRIQSGKAERFGRFVLR